MEIVKATQETTIGCQQSASWKFHNEDPRRIIIKSGIQTQ